MKVILSKRDKKLIINQNYKLICRKFTKNYIYTHKNITVNLQLYLDNSTTKFSFVLN